MNVVEYENDILVIDAGMEFADDKYAWCRLYYSRCKLSCRKKKNIKGIVITHGHLESLLEL